jgi:hypothetical protein
MFGLPGKTGAPDQECPFDEPWTSEIMIDGKHKLNVEHRTQDGGTMQENEGRRKERQQELEKIAKVDPEQVEKMFREYFPHVTPPVVGSLMIQNILAHEFDMEPARFRG